MTWEAYHAAVWAEIDAAAERLGKSPCGLAKSCGLDSTSFNQSKREGRFPSLPTVLLVCSAAGISLTAFSQAVEARQPAARAA